MTPRFQGNFTQQLPITEEGIERAVAVMRSGRLHRYNVIDDEVPETVQLENEFAAYMGARWGNRAGWNSSGSVTPSRSRIPAATTPGATSGGSPCR